jgi:hypothetical protein
MTDRAQWLIGQRLLVEANATSSQSCGSPLQTYETSKRI